MKSRQFIDRQRAFGYIVNSAISLSRCSKKMEHEGREMVHMPITAKRKDKETQGAFLRRFTRKVQQSGVLVSARKKRFFEPEPNKRLVRAKALRKEQTRKKIEILKKLGKFEERRGRGRGRRR